MPKVMSWATYKKKYKPEIRQYQESTIGMIYKVEPTMRYAGFCPDHYDGKNGYGVHPDDGKPKKQILEYIKKQYYYDKAELVVYYVWHVRGEYGTVMIDIWFK